MNTEILPGVKQFDLHGKVAVITGGSKGLGLAMAAGLASAGANIMLVNRNENEGVQAAKDLATDYKIKAVGFSADVGDIKQTEAMAKAAIETFGKIDILINSAGINIRGPIDEITPDDFTKVNEQLNTLRAIFEWSGHLADTTRVQRKHRLNENEQLQFVSGRQLYLTTCAGCHGSDGNGLNRFAPPLIGSDWVLGDEKRLALILLHGMEGPVQVNGKLYDAPDILPVMPSHSTMDDGSIASILTYIRNEWGNDAGPVSRRTVGMTRVTSQGRVVPWTAADLDKHISEIKAKEEK